MKRESSSAAAAAAGVMLLASLLGADGALAQTRPATRNLDFEPLRNLAAERPALDLAQSTVTTEDVIPEGLPVVMWVRTPNVSGRAIRPHMTGPGTCFEAGRFAVQVTRAGEEPRLARPRNGQFGQGLMSPVDIPAGGALRTPLAIEPLPRGEYDAELWEVERVRLESKPTKQLTTFKFRVVADAGERARWIERRLAEVRRGEPFAASVCLSFKVDEVTSAMVTDLAGDDPDRAHAAARLFRLYHHSRLDNDGGYPAGLADAVVAALEKHVDDPPPARGSGRSSTGSVLLHLTQRMRVNDRLLALILKYSHSDHHDTRDAAVMALQSYHQPESSDRLAQLLDHPNHGWLAGHALASRGDVRGVVALARRANEQNPKRSGGRSEFDLLVMYPDVAEARDAVTAGLASPDPDIRRSAERAVRPEVSMRHPTGRDAAHPAMTIPEAMMLLLGAGEFVLIDETNAADAPAVVLAHRMVSHGSGSHAAAHHLLRAGTPAGKLYGLSILYFTSDPRLERWAEGVASKGGDVVVVNGAASETVPVAKVVERILTGEYPKRLTRLYSTARP